MGKGCDKSKRTRRKKTDEEKEATRQKKQAEQRAKDLKRHGSVSKFFCTAPKKNEDTFSEGSFSPMNRCWESYFGVSSSQYL